MGLTAQDWKGALGALLPRGLAWSGDTFKKLLHGFATELARADQRLDDLFSESIPTTATETLPEWEKMLGLPTDGAIPTAVRRNKILTNLTAIGGQSKAYFQYLANRLGYLFGLEEYPVARAGRVRCGDRLNDTPWGFTFKVITDEAVAVEFRVDEDSVESPLRYWNNVDLEDIINRLKPAHTHAIFAYNSTYARVGTARCGQRLRQIV